MIVDTYIKKKQSRASWPGPARVRGRRKAAALPQTAQAPPVTQKPLRELLAELTSYVEATNMAMNA